MFSSTSSFEDAAAVEFLCAEQSAHRLGAAGADQSGKADDLAGPNGEADILERASPG